MGLQPKQPRGRAGPGRGEAAFSCQGGALLRLSFLEGPHNRGGHASEVGGGASQRPHK